MSALLAKKRGNRERFYGRELSVQYAPELETSDELKEKLEWRIQRVSEGYERATQTAGPKKAICEKDFIDDEEVKRVEEMLKMSKSLKQQLFEEKEDNR